MSGRSAETGGAMNIEEAAERLGISIETLQTVLEHGFLKGFQDDEGRWTVILEGDQVSGETVGRSKGAAAPPAASKPAPRAAATTPPAAPQAESTPPPPAATRPDPAPRRQPERFAADPAPTADVSAAERLLREQVEYLRGELERRDRLLAEKDALLAKSNRQMAKLGRAMVRRLGAPAGRGPADSEHQALRSMGEVLITLGRHLAKPERNDD